MPKKRRYQIIATPDAAAPHGHRFDLQSDKGQKADLDFNKDNDQMAKVEDYELVFSLVNRDGAALRFSGDPATVLWAKPLEHAGDSCPTSACHWPVFRLDPDKPIKDDEVHVLNSDPSEQRFAFAFNFLRSGESDGPQASYVCFDPIGTNKNGGYTAQPQSFLTSSTGIALALVGVAAVAVFATMALR